MIRAQRLRRWAIGLVVAATCVLATALPVPAQSPVRIVGEVQWVSATSMAVMTEPGVSIVVIELMQVDQSAYRGLRTRDWILIACTLAPDRRYARDTWRDDRRGGAWAQSP